MPLYHWTTATAFDELNRLYSGFPLASILGKLPTVKAVGPDEASELVGAHLARTTAPDTHHWTWDIVLYRQLPDVLPPTPGATTSRPADPPKVTTLFRYRLKAENFAVRACLTPDG